MKGKIKDVNVYVRGATDVIGDTTMTLLPPNGPEITAFDISAINIQNNIGSGPANCDGDMVRLDDEANNEIADEDGDAEGGYQPAEALSKLDGKSPTGNWRLLLSSGSNQDGGTLYCFQVKIKTR